MNRMKAVRTSHRIEPRDIEPGLQSRLVDLLNTHVDDAHPVTIECNGTFVNLPTGLTEGLRYLAAALARNEAVILSFEERALSPQAAADFLGISRPYLLRLLHRGDIAWHWVGSHRRIVFRDLEAYRRARDQQRHARLDSLASVIDKEGCYEF